jgi:hypothetical protein
MVEINGFNLEHETWNLELKPQIPVYCIQF